MFPPRSSRLSFSQNIDIMQLLQRLNTLWVCGLTNATSQTECDGIVRHNRRLSGGVYTVISWTFSLPGTWAGNDYRVLTAKFIRERLRMCIRRTGVYKMYADASLNKDTHFRMYFIRATTLRIYIFGVFHSCIILRDTDRFSSTSTKLQTTTTENM